MAKSSPFSFDISVSADKKRRAKKRGLSGAIETSSRLCEHEGCKEAGKYRAPKSPDDLEDFFWFCKDHIREYNKKWNFFENHTPEEFEESVEKDKVWGRDTKPFQETLREKSSSASHPEGQAFKRFGFDDPYEVLGENGTLNPAHAQSASQRRLPPTERKAIEILGAGDAMTKSEIRKVYKSMVKAMHPDLNGGRRDDEERLAEVVWAWDQIKGSRSFKE